MATLGYTTATHIGDLSLTYYLRGPAISQTMQDKPLLRLLEEKAKDIPGTGGASRTVAVNVQGTYMSDTPGFLQGYTQDQSIAFNQSDNTRQASYTWYEQAASLIITETELKQGGIQITDNMKESKASDAAISIVTDVMENRISDFMESWKRAKNLMYWQDGSADPNYTPGVLSIVTDDPTSGTIGGIASGNGIRGSSATWWWYNRARVGGLAYQVGTGMNAITSPTGPKITPSATDQTLSRILRAELRQLRRFGGNPKVALCGAQFLDALDYEYQNKGLYTIEGFSSGGKNELGINKISLNGLGMFEYDPTLDDLGLSKRCYILDLTKMQRRPLAGNADKMRSPTRPYNYFVFLKTITDASALACTMRSCHGVYEVA